MRRFGREALVAELDASMQQDVIDVLRAEEAELAEKLRAIRAVLDVYAPRAPQINPSVLKASVPTVPPSPVPSAGEAESAALVKAVLSRNAYADHVRSVAREIILARQNAVTPTREIVEAVQQRGIEIRGQSPLNAVSALLSRNDDFENVDRQGWRLKNASLNENGALNGNAVSAPEAGGGATPPIENRYFLKETLG